MFKMKPGARHERDPFFVFVFVVFVMLAWLIPPIITTKSRDSYVWLATR